MCLLVLLANILHCSCWGLEGIETGLSENWDKFCVNKTDKQLGLTDGADLVKIYYIVWKRKRMRMLSS